MPGMKKQPDNQARHEVVGDGVAYGYITHSKNSN